MKVQVKVKTKAKKELVEKISDKNFLVAVKEPAQEGKANAAVEKAIAKCFKLPQVDVRIISGFKSKQKILEINI